MGKTMWRSMGICLALLLAGGGASANDKAFQPGLSGDWNGARNDLKDQGWQFQARGLFEGAVNPAGGRHEATTGAGELDFAVLGDLGKLIGDDGGSLETKITDRFGANLVTAAGLGTLMQVQEIWGRGEMWRLTQLSWSQDLFNKALNIEAGRINPGGDFDVFACNFQNLNFCGPPAGAIDGDYWFDSPVSQWGARAKMSLNEVSDAEVGLYQVNPANLRHGFSFDFSGGKGALIPFKAEWKPSLVAGLPGDFQIGGWYATMAAADVFYDINRAPAVSSGLPALVDHGRSGLFLSARQQLAGEAPAKGAPVGTNGKGLTVFFNYTRSDRRTSRLDSQLGIGLIYKGALGSRPEDEIALAFGATHVNGRLAESALLQNEAGLSIPVPHTEYVTELDYRAIMAPGVEFSPNLQYVADPGGIASRRDVLVLGLKAVLTL
jgi:porin